MWGWWVEHSVTLRQSRTERKVSFFKIVLFMKLDFVALPQISNTC